MNRSEQINELAAALSKAQGQMQGAIKDSANPYFKSKYADLASVWDACRAALSSNGLAIIQTAETTAETVSLETVLAHSSGQFISNVLTIPIGKHDAQGIGSAITYARRFALAAMVGVAPEDDDGNAAADGMKRGKKANSEDAQKILAEGAKGGTNSLRAAFKTLSHDMRETVSESCLNAFRVTAWMADIASDECSCATLTEIRVDVQKLPESADKARIIDYIKDVAQQREWIFEKKEDKFTVRSPNGR